MSMTKAARRIRNVYSKRPGGAAVLLIGQPGMTKSATILALGRELQAQDPDFGMCYVNASGLQSIDYVGWPLQSNGLVSANSVPLIFQPQPNLGLRGAYPALCEEDERYISSNKITLDDLKPYPRGIIIVDEASKVSGEDVMASQSMLAHEGRTGMWWVPVGGDAAAWVRVFIANRQEDNSNDLPFPATFDNRVARIEVTMDFNDVRPHWEAIGMHPWFQRFAAANASLVFSQSVPAQGGQFGSARSWTEAWYDVNAYLEHDIGIPDMRLPDPDDATYPTIEWPCYYPDDGLFSTVLDPSTKEEDVPGVTEWANEIFDMIASRCGSVIAGQFTDFVAHMNERPTYDEIVSDPTNCKLPTHPGVLHYTLEMILSEIHLDDMDDLVKYLRRMPRALGSIFCTRMLTKFPLGLVKRRSFHDFMTFIGDGGRAALDGWKQSA
jgi:hypothetical protein